MVEQSSTSRGGVDLYGQGFVSAQSSTVRGGADPPGFVPGLSSIARGGDDLPGFFCPGTEFDSSWWSSSKRSPRAEFNCVWRWSSFSLDTRTFG